MITRNEQVSGSSPLLGSLNPAYLRQIVDERRVGGGRRQSTRFSGDLGLKRVLYSLRLRRLRATTMENAVGRAADTAEVSSYNELLGAC